MHAFVSVKLICPLCGLEFSVDERHGDRPVALETDFRPVYAGHDPLASWMHSCPACRYSGYREAFGLTPSDEDELLEPVEDDPRALPRPGALPPVDDDADALRRYARSGDLWRNLVPAGKDPFGAVRYLLAGRVYEFRSEQDPLGAAHYLLRAAWCSRVVDDRKMEREAMRGALIRVAGLIEPEIKGGPARATRWLYLVGELSRRVGNFGPALEYFAQVESLADADDDEMTLLAALARRQARLAVVKSSVNALVPPEWLSTDRRGRREAVDADLEDDEEQHLPDDELDDDFLDDDEPRGGGLN